MKKEEKRNVGRPQKHSLDTILEAVKGSAGIKSAITKKLNIDHKTLQSYINKYQEVREALEVETESVLDMAEGTLFKLIQSGETSAIFYFLNNRGQSRGYNVPREKNDAHASGDQVKLVMNLAGKPNAVKAGKHG